MTLRDDLEKVIGAVKQADTSQSDYDFANAGDKAFYLLRDHGQALLEAVRDAERYRWGVDNARWVRHEHEAYVAVPVALDSNLSCVALRTSAIDAAMEGER